MKKLEFKKLAILGIISGGTVLSAQVGAVTTDVSSIGSSLVMGCASCGNKNGSAPNLSASCGGGNGYRAQQQQPSQSCGNQPRVANGCGGQQGRSYNYQQRSYTADAGTVNVNNPMAPQGSCHAAQPGQMAPQGSCSANKAMPMQGQPQAMPMQQGQPQAMPVQPGQSAGYNQPRYQQQRGYVSDASHSQSNSIMSEEEKRANMGNGAASAQHQRGDWGNRGDNRQGRMGPSGQPSGTPQ